MTCTKTTNIVRDADLSGEDEGSKLPDRKVSDDDKPEPRGKRIRRLEPKPSFLFGYVDL
jgi:hypothetical protein